MTLVRWTGVMVLATLVGCGSRTIDADSLAQAQESYDQAIAAVESGDSEAALALLNAALAPGNGLPPDLYTDGLIQRSVCYARVGKFDQALADLQIAEQGSSDLAIVHAARAYVFRKQGDTSAANAEMSAAKKLDRKVKAFRD